MDGNKKLLLLILLVFFSNFTGLSYIIQHRFPLENSYFTSYKANTSLYNLELSWNTTWGGELGDGGLGIAVDSLGNIYVCGYTKSFGEGNSDIALVKFAANGTKLWNTTWGGAASDSADDIAIDSQGDIYICGETWSYGVYAADFVIIKYAPNGTQLWNRTWGGDSTDTGEGITIDSADNLFICGKTRSFGAAEVDIVLIKYDVNGTQLWNTTWGGGYSDSAYGITHDIEGNIHVCGSTESFGAGNFDFILVKFDTNGSQLQNTTWGGVSNEVSSEVAVDSTGNLYVCGYTASFGAGNNDFVLVKFDPDYNTLWTSTWGGNSYDVGYGLTIDSQKNVYVCGITYNFGAELGDLALVMFTENGAINKTAIWGSLSDDSAYAVTTDPSSNVYVCGQDRNEIALIKNPTLSPQNGGIPVYNLILSMMSIMAGIAIVVLKRTHILR